MGRDENVTGDNATAVAQADLQRGAEATLVVPAEVVVEPDKGDGLGNVGSGCDEVDRHVADADRDVVLGKENDVADGADHDAEDDEAEAVAEAIAEQGDGEGSGTSDDIYRNGAQLGADGGPAELSEDGWGEKYRAVAGGDGSHVHEYSFWSAL